MTTTERPKTPPHDARMDRPPHPPSWWRRTLARLADLLPISLRDQEEDDRLAARGVDQSEGRLQRLRIGRFEKKGRGGFG